MLNQHRLVRGAAKQRLARYGKGGGGSLNRPASTIRCGVSRRGQHAPGAEAVDVFLWIHVRSVPLCGYSSNLESRAWGFHEEV